MAGGTSDFDYCAQTLKRWDYDRYFMTLLAPARLRPALLALYAFNVEVAKTRESVSEAMLGEIRLQWWREAIAGLFADSPRDHAVVRAIHAAWAGRPEAAPGFTGLIDARAFDLTDQAPATLETFLRYTEETGGALTALAGQAAQLPARFSKNVRAAGQAYAIAGLLRAIPAHARHGRSYLPRDLLIQAGLEPEDVHRGAAVVPIVRALAARAESLIGQIAETAPEIARRHRHLLLPARLARFDLRRLAAAAHDPERLPAMTPRLPRQWCLLTGVLSRPL